MNIIILLSLLDRFSKIHKIPIYVYKGEEEIHAFEPVQTNYILIQKAILRLKDVDTVNIYVDSKGLLVGKIKYEEYDLYFGPINSLIKHVNLLINDLVDEYKNQISENELRLFLSRINTSSIHEFEKNIEMFYESIMHFPCPTIHPISDIDIYKAEYVSLDLNRFEEMEKTWIQKNMNLVKELSYEVKNGIVDGMTNFGLDEVLTPIQNIKDGKMRSQKNLTVILTFVCSYAAYSVGLNHIVIEELVELYLLKFEACQTVNELKRTLINMKRDFCARVQELTLKDINHPSIQKAKVYITDNISQRLSVNDIASEIGISKEYLSSLFIKETGMSIVEYTNREKIRVAKRLLGTTNRSISYISEYLSFSSQSYFQSIFKKYEGMTPNQYRLHKKSRSF